MTNQNCFGWGKTAKQVVRAIVLLCAYMLILFVNDISAQDPRSWQHGVDFVPRGNGNYWLIWGSSGNPPTGEDQTGSWIHDIYYSNINPANPVISPVTLISKPEAQEPPSSAASDAGTIYITMEDGWNAQNSIAQRYGVYSQNDLSDVMPYPQMVLDGGHSGHVAAVGSDFVVVYSDGWITGGGYVNNGSGDDIYVEVYNQNGVWQRTDDVILGATRDDWPLIAGSNNRALMLWEQVVAGQDYSPILYAVYNPANGSLVKQPTQLENWVGFYAYDVQYLPTINRFLVVGSYWDGGGFAYLIDNSGTVVTNDLSLPDIPKEAQLAVRQTANGLKVAYPRYPSGLAVLKVTSSSISLDQEINDSYQWQQPLGIDGIFVDDDNVYVVALSQSGLVEKHFSLNGSGGTSPKLATGIINNVGSSWKTVNLSQSYNSMVVVCSANYSSSDDPAVVRVRNASGSSFQMKVQNPGGTWLSGYKVHYTVVEEGVYSQAADGVQMEAMKTTSTITDRKYSWSGQSLSYSNSYSFPVVVGQVMSANDADWSVFWARGSSRGNPPSSSRLYVGKHVGEDYDKTRANETLGYIVIEAGNGSIDGVSYTAATGSDIVRGIASSPPYTYSLSGLASAKVAVVSPAAMDGGDGGWPQLYGSTPLTASNLKLAIDEDQIGDSERWHTTEQVAYIVFSSSVAKTGGLQEAEETLSTQPNDFRLLQNYPNPFNPSTNIRFSLPVDGRVTLGIFDVRGRQIATLVDGRLQAGNHNIIWNAAAGNQAVDSGLYIARLRSGGRVKSIKLLLIK